MGWPASVLVGVLTAAVGMVLAGYVANLSVDWHRVSSFEGGAGYFVVALAILGFAGGLIIGIVASRIVAAGANPGFVRALGLGQAVTVGIILMLCAVSRLTADIAPRLDGEELLLAVELKWPQGRSPADVADTGEWRIRLGAMSGQTMRASRQGPFWREDARLEDGHWVVPGAVEVFTSRGGRVLDVEPDDVIDHGYIIPLPGRPGRPFLEWSEWLPRGRPGGPEPPPGFRYRFRVVPVSQPIRTESFGPFEVTTIARSFRVAHYQDRRSELIADAQFEVRHRGRPVVVEHAVEGQSTPVRFERMDGVAALHGAQPAMLLQVNAPRAAGPCYMIAEEGDQLRIEHVTLCTAGIPAVPLTSDPEFYARAQRHRAAVGRFDRASFAVDGPYLLGGVVLDTRTLTIRHVSTPPQTHVIDRIPPLDVSPDAGSYVRIANADEPDGVRLIVFDLATQSTYAVDIDQDRTRFPDIDGVDPGWVRHYFEWQPAGAGYRLVERLDVTPLPYRGRSHLDSDGYREYRVAPAREGLRAAVIEFLVAEFGAERLQTEESRFSHEVSVDGAIVHVSYRAEDRHVDVWMDRGTDSQLVAAIAERFDAALGTGWYDHHFGR